MNRRAMVSQSVMLTSAKSFQTLASTAEPTGHSHQSSPAKLFGTLHVAVCLSRSPSNEQGNRRGKGHPVSPASCAALRRLRRREKPAIVPNQSTRQCGFANSGHFLEVGLKVACFPFGNSPLRNARDGGHLSL